MMTKRRTREKKAGLKMEILSAGQKKKEKTAETRLFQTSRLTCERVSAFISAAVFPSSLGWNVVRSL